MASPLNDRIEVRGLVVTTVVGVLPHERTIAQPLQIDLDLHVDLRDAGRTDDLSDTADYGDVAERVAAVVRESKDTLLERLADRVAEMLVTIDRVEAADVKITKLRPPIPEQLDSTAVHIHRSRRDYDDVRSDQHQAIIALGSSLGDREGYLRLAVGSFDYIQAISQVFETDPVGGPDGQGAYLNMVMAVRTTLDPYALLRRCRQIEAAAYRQRVLHWGPRTLDLDLLFYDDVHIDDPYLTVPHPRFAERRFVVAPLQEVAPERCPANWDATLPSGGVYPRGPLQPGADVS